MDKQAMICGFKAEELLLVAELLYEKPMLLEDIKCAYKAGFEKGYKDAVAEFNKSVTKEINRIVLKESIIDYVDNANKFQMPKITFKPIGLPEETIEDKCARLYMQKVVQPKMAVVIRTEEKNNG